MLTMLYSTQKQSTQPTHLHIRTYKPSKMFNTSQLVACYTLQLQNVKYIQNYNIHIYRIILKYKLTYICTT